MQSRLYITCVVLAVLAACAKKEPPPRAVAPEQVTPATSRPESQVSRDTAKAQALIEQGRAVQREKGEDGTAEAIALYQQALEADPLSAAALWELGWSYQVQEDWDQAVAAWTKLKALDPKYPQLETYFPVLMMRRDQAKLLASLPEAEVAPPELMPREGPTIRLRAVGDIQMGRAWPEEFAQVPPNDGHVLFEHVRDQLADADVTFGNVETVLADEGESTKCKKNSRICYAFRAPSRFANTLKEVGFDFVSIANNHTGDFGEAGRQHTVEALDQAGIHHSGPVGDIASFEVKGLKVGMVAFGTGGGLYRVQDIETATKVVADVDRTHDLVIVSFHGGAEGSKALHVPKEEEIFFGENRGDVYAFAHAVIDAGADLVLGHGPHVMRAMETYKGRFIAYSLGNFCAWYGFNLSGPLGRTGILEVELAPNGVALNAKLIPLKIEKPGVPQPDPEGVSIKDVNRLSHKDLGTKAFDREGQYAWEPPKHARTATR